MKESKGLVFDIKRFALHDGQGLRTTIFLKGCPLKCQWCHNPEGINQKRQLLYFKEKCIHCRRCEQSSSREEIVYENDRPYFHKGSNYDKVIQYCPSNALQYDSQEYSVDELLKEIEKDQIFYKYEGGVTFSGGEPFIQYDYLFECLKELSSKDIPTVIETSLYTTRENIESVLPYIQTLYVDLKLFDEKEHLMYTGVSSKRIKENIKFVLESEYRDKVIIRTPLIPHITATHKNIANIAKFISHIYKDVSYELLNYNVLASSKYDLLDQDYMLEKSLKMFQIHEMNNFYDRLKENGVHNIISEEEKV